MKFKSRPSKNFNGLDLVLGELLHSLTSKSEINDCQTVHDHHCGPLCTNVKDLQQLI